MRVFVAGATGVISQVAGLIAAGLVLRYGAFYGHGASDRMLEVVRKRQMPVVDGGTGIWSFIEVTDAARWRSGFPAWAEEYEAGAGGS